MLEGLQEHYGLDPGETTADDRLSLLTARCVGACGLAPAVVVDREVLGKQAADTLVATLEELS